ncbi:MAG: hypothetical protein FJ276_26315 [Planctomycetes bacterium]|nr:hypothetical protein [Planctomycetota bacterium]
MMKRLALGIAFGLLGLALLWVYFPRKRPETGVEKLFRNRDAAIERHAKEWIEYLVGDWDVSGTAWAVRREGYAGSIVGSFDGEEVELGPRVGEQECYTGQAHAEKVGEFLVVKYVPALTGPLKKPVAMVVMFWDPEEKKLVWFHLPDEAAVSDVVASGEALRRFDNRPAEFRQFLNGELNGFFRNDNQQPEALASYGGFPQAQFSLQQNGWTGNFDVLKSMIGLSTETISKTATAFRHKYQFEEGDTSWRHIAINHKRPTQDELEDDPMPNGDRENR